MMIQIDQIKIRDNWNIRKKFNPSDCNQLIASIKEVGLQHPIVINQNDELVAGYRRLFSCKSIGWLEIPATTIEYKSELHERIAHIDENILSRSLSERELEVALSEKKKIYSLLYPKAEKTGPKKEDEPKSFAKDTAEKSGKTPREINKLTKRVDDVTKLVREAYEDGNISSSQIDELARLTKEDQDKLLPRAKGMSVAETKLMVDDFIKKTRAKVSGKGSNIEIDDKNIEVILESERLLRAIKTTDVLINGFINGNKFIFLDEDHFKSLKATVKSLSETLSNFKTRLEQN